MRDFLIIISLGSMYIYRVSSATLILITAAYSWRICTTLSILQLSQTRFPRINKEFPLLFVWVYRDRFTFDRCLSSDWWNSWIFLACHTSIAGSFCFFRIICYKEFDTLLFWHPSSPTSNSKTTQSDFPPLIPHLQWSQSKTGL